MKVDFYNGLTYSPNDIVADDGTLVLRSSNIQNGEIDLNDNVYVNAAAVNSDNVEIDDIVVVVRNGSKALIGKHAQIKINMPQTVIGAFMTGIRSKHSDFLNALLSTKIFGVEIEKNMGATINQITGGMFKRMSFLFPHEKERARIGEFFTNIDDLITLHQRKHDELIERSGIYKDKTFDIRTLSKKRKGFQYVLVYQLDRFARNRYDSATYKAKLKKNGVRVLSAKENITDDASGILIEGVLESMAEYYSAELSQKVKRGIAMSAAKCKYFGGVIPLGYKVNSEKSFVLDEELAPVVKKCLSRGATMPSLSAI